MSAHRVLGMLCLVGLSEGESIAFGGFGGLAGAGLRGIDFVAEEFFAAGAIDLDEDCAGNGAEADDL